MFQVYFISLKTDEKRRIRLKEQFIDYDKFNWIEGINGKELSLDEYYSCLSNSYMAYNQFLTPSEIGCAMSHMKALSKFLDDVKNQAGGGA